MSATASVRPKKALRLSKRVFDGGTSLSAMETTPPTPAVPNCRELSRAVAPFELAHCRGKAVNERHWPKREDPVK